MLECFDACSVPATLQLLLVVRGLRGMHGLLYGGWCVLWFPGCREWVLGCFSGLGGACLDWGGAAQQIFCFHALKEVCKVGIWVGGAGGQ